MIGKTETAFTNDIAEKVAKELGMSKTKILYHIDFMTHWIKCLVKIKDVLSIYLPHIGSLYFNYSATKWTQPQGLLVLYIDQYSVCK